MVNFSQTSDIHQLQDIANELRRDVLEMLIKA
jgi:hypothetical protein